MRFNLLFEMAMSKLDNRPDRSRRVAPKHSEATRARLISAAGEVFAEYGFQAAKVRDICRRAGANVAAVNYHFGDKLGLYSEILRQPLHAEHVKRGIEFHDSAQMPPEEKLRSIIRARVEGLRAAELPQWQFRIMAREMTSPTPAFARVLDQVAGPLYRRLRELVGSIIDLPPDDERVWLCVLTIAGQIFLYAACAPTVNRLWPGLKLDPEQLSRIADHIADSSIAYLHKIRAAGSPANRNSAGTRHRG